MEDIKTENMWLMQGDCLKRMKEIPSGSVSMILTDPPYELSKSKGGRMLNGSRKFLRQVRDAGMIDGINTKAFLDVCLAMFSHKQKFCGVFTCQPARQTQSHRDGPVPGRPAPPLVTRGGGGYQE